MPDTADPENSLLAALTGQYTMTLCGGRAELHCDSLPGDTVSAAARVDGVLHVFIDLDKPSAAKHARQMLLEWLGFDIHECVNDVVRLALAD